MGLLQKACETYDSFARLAGIVSEGQVPLAPISHMLTSSDIEITIDRDGRFMDARAVDKKEPKIIIPVTKESSNRAGKQISPHALCDELSYISSGCNQKKLQTYINNLDEWVNSEYMHPKLNPILTYVKSETILQDLQARNLIALDNEGMLDKKEEGKYFIRWVVNGLGIENSGPCWTDLSLFQSFIQYYETKLRTQNKMICMVTGKYEVPMEKHPKGIVPFYGSAKLISSNDDVNFTYRGRFSESWQAMTVSYTASQKAHNALSWIVANQGVRVAMPGDKQTEYGEGTSYTSYGGRTFLCWNPQGNKVLHAAGGAMSIKSEKPRIKPAEYKDALAKTLASLKNDLPQDADVVIAAFDATSKKTGRLSLTYYNELLVSDFLDRLFYWDETCCWENGTDGVQQPSLFQIINYAFGSYRDGKFVTDDQILRQQMQRLISCRVDKRPFPYDIEQQLVQRVPRMYLYKNNANKNNTNKNNERRQLLFCTCAVIQKYHADHDQDKERWSMQTDLSTRDCSFQFGRLLAVLEKTEQDYYRKTGENGQDERETNAIRMMAAYCQCPWKTYTLINQKLRTAYLPRMKPQQRTMYKKRTDEIVGIIIEIADGQLNRPLADTYLLGYHLQRNEMYKKKDIDIEEEEN